MRPSRTSFFGLVALVLAGPVASGRDDAKTVAPAPSIRHSFLTMGSKTAIVAEDGSVEWEYTGGTRDGFVLPGGNVLLAFANRVEEVTRDRKVVFSYSLDASNQEIGTTQRLYDGNTLITELGKNPRLLEVDPAGRIVNQFALEPETDNAHLQTRMARQLRNGNFLVPHLLAFSLKEYSPTGEIVRVMKTDLPEVNGRDEENWPFTAIRLDDGNTLVAMTHGNKVAEFDIRGAIVWKITNDDVGGLFKDCCGCQRLANGNTVIGSHAASSGTALVEVTRDKKIVWTCEHPAVANVHHFQILTTNGRPEPGTPMR